MDGSTPKTIEPFRLPRNWGILSGNPWLSGTLSLQMVVFIFAGVAAFEESMTLLALPILLVLIAPAVLWRAEVQGTHLCCFVGPREILRVDLSRTAAIQIDTSPWGMYKHRVVRLRAAHVISFNPVPFIGRLRQGWEHVPVDISVWAMDGSSEKALRIWLDTIGPLTKDGAKPWAGGWRTSGVHDRESQS